MKKRRLWLDDVRLPPFEYDIYCPDAQTAIRFIDAHWGEIEHMSLDHDLGDESYQTGYDVLKFIEEKVHVEGWEPNFTIHIHSDNAAGIQNMRAAIQSIFKDRSSPDSSL
jgi:hypothetical protein